MTLDSQFADPENIASATLQNALFCFCLQTLLTLSAEFLLPRPGTKNREAYIYSKKKNGI